MLFPETQEACKKLAETLIDYLRSSLNETDARREWSNRNFSLLYNFADQNGLAAFPKRGEGKRGEFLWDWSAFTPNDGLLIACESEWDLDTRNEHKNPKHDFAKLLFAFCPIKLALCWVSTSEQAKDLQSSLAEHFNKDYAIHQPGAVFILYCICAQTKRGDNKDIVYVFQAGGHPIIRRETVAFKLTTSHAK